MKVNEYLVMWKNESKCMSGRDYIQALNAQQAADIIWDGDKNTVIVEVALICKDWVQPKCNTNKRSVKEIKGCKKTLIDIQNEVISKYRIDLCDRSKCDDDWSRTHAHPKKRRVCKWKQAASIKSTFDLFHEIGHIENNHGKMRRCEEEYHATVWAVEKMKEYGLASKITDAQKGLYQRYIWNERDRGVRRGGVGYPTKEQLTIEW